ncbi:MAG: PEP-CTERM sorting domain-containing protein [Desulfuromonadales bacterium]
MFKKVIVSLAGLAMILASSGAAQATLTTLVDQGSSWQYQQFAQPDLWSNWNAAGYSSFGWNSATWSTGNAAFGNNGGLPQSTYWLAGTDLALQKNFRVDGTINGLLKLNVAADNGFIIFINGTQVAKANAEGYTSVNPWEYTLDISSSPFVFSGNNLIQVLAEDHGGSTYFDMKLTADVAPVPEPSTLLLFGAGLGGFALWRRKKS